MQNNKQHHTYSCAHIQDIHHVHTLSAGTLETNQCLHLKTTRTHCYSDLLYSWKTSWIYPRLTFWPDFLSLLLLDGSSVMQHLQGHFPLIWSRLFQLMFKLIVQVRRWRNTRKGFFKLKMCNSHSLPSNPFIGPVLSKPGLWLTEHQVEKLWRD